ncbi:MAG TPA: hypothetical protein VHS56_09190 [Candidatus Cybelea sp.]|jgi:hypothetical protein|nr:hypothetical protein [Candidatus Cybelea sp.]
MLAIVTFLFAALNNMVAQAPPQGPPPAQSMQPPLESGACLDSPRPVPKVLQKPVSRGMQIVRIDEVVSTATMTQGQVIGFVYTTQDGGTWLGERTANFTSPANATEINALLASTRTTGVKDTKFPPQTEYGVATKYPQFFRVSVPPDAMGPLRITLVSCVAWPAGRPLPDPGL